MGADVIRIEKCDGGEDRWVQSVGSDGVGAGFLQCNRNKRSAAIDIASAEGREVVRRLVANADVVVANMPSQTLQSLGLDYDSLKVVKPDIIFANATAYGSGGPYSDRIGFDGIGQVMSGAVARTGTEEQPIRTMVPYVDHSTALSLALATMMALYHRLRTGEGQQVEAALLPSALCISNGLLIEQAVLKSNIGRVGNRGLAISPCDLFRVVDGWILVQVTGNAMFRRWCKMVDREEWSREERFATDGKRAELGDVLNGRMRAWCAELSVEEVMEQLDSWKIPASPVLSPEQVLHDPHIAAMEYLKALEYPTVAGTVPVMETPFRMSQTPGAVRVRAPMLGEQTKEVLGEIGYDVDGIAKLKAAGVIL